jgi:hypothetical protein
MVQATPQPRAPSKYALALNDYPASSVGATLRKLSRHLIGTQMSLKAIKTLIQTAPIYKMSLGKNARYRQEAIERGALVFQSEQRLYDAVVLGAQDGIEQAALLVKTDEYPKANAPRGAWSLWVRTIKTFRELPENALVLHWEANEDRLHWGLVGPNPFTRERAERNDFGQDGYIFHRALRGGWKTGSVHDVPISNIHPSARPLAINMATLNSVQTDPDYFRALILDQDTSLWTDRAEWAGVARAKGWHPKSVGALREARRQRAVTPDVEEAAEHVLSEAAFFEDIARMADTAVRTAAYANGQTVLRTVKAKEIGFTRAELEEEIAVLLAEQENRCALTGHGFRRGETNPHLKLSLDRKDSSLGYVSGNLQVVTRAANFYKSASDAADWALKEDALFRMAVAIQKRRKSAESGSAT